MKGQQTQHTPGPWKFDEVWHLILGPAGEEVAALHSGQGSNIKRNKLEVVEENARLIAAAPELYESLRALESRLTACAHAFYVEGKPSALRAAFGGWKEDIEPARSAIAKATQS